MEEQRGLYIMSVAARISGMHPQTLRKYERAGFIKPARTGGMMRLYSAEDIARLQLIKHLVEDLKLNLAGVKLALNLANKLLSLKRAIYSLQDDPDFRVLVESEIKEMLKILGMPNLWDKNS